jgi:hypothetical protein
MIQQLLAAAALIGISVAIQGFGMVAMVYRVVRHAAKQHKRPSIFRGMFFLIRVGISLIALHLLQSAIWAAFFSYRNCFPDFATSFYFSLDCYTTLGFGDELLPIPWRLLGGFEAATGILMFGCSTAFLIALATRLYQLWAIKLGVTESLDHLRA